MAKWSKNIITYNASLQKGGVGFVQQCIPKPIGRCLMVSKDLWNEKALTEHHILTVTACGTEVGQEELLRVQSTVWFGLEETGSWKFLSYWSALEKVTDSGQQPKWGKAKVHWEAHCICHFPLEGGNWTQEKGMQQSLTSGNMLSAVSSKRWLLWF